MEKPTADALAAFDHGFPDDPRAIRKKMFGMPAGFVNGNMFYGVFANGVVLRLPAERRAEIGEMPGMGPFEPRPGAPWREYLLADATIYGTGDHLGEWAREDLEHTALMPEKKTKKKTKKKTRK
jgi:hypothetical protein